MKDPDAARNLGDHPAAECGFLGGFDQVDLHETGHVWLSRQIRKERADRSIAVGRCSQPRGVNCFEGGPRLVESLGYLRRRGVTDQGGDQAVHRLVSRDERTGVAHEELIFDQLRHVLLGLGLADLVIDQHLRRGLQSRSSAGLLQHGRQIGTLVDSDEMVRATGSGQPSLCETHATSCLVEAGVGRIHEELAELRVMLDGIGQRPQVVHVEPTVTLVPLPRLQVQPGPPVDGADGASRKQTEGRGSGRRSAEVRHHGGLDLAASLAVRFPLPNLEGLVQAR
jgi:hypothetical protein